MSDLHEVCCFSCDRLFVVTGELPEDMWRCEDCQQAADEAADEGLQAQWHGGSSWPYLGER